MRVTAVAVFLLGGIPLVAQSSPPMIGTPSERPTIVCDQRLPPDGKLGNGGPVIVCTTTPAAQGCPVDIRVRQRMGGGMVAVDENGVKRHVFAPRLRLFLNDLGAGKAGQKIVSATVTVRGSNGMQHIQRLEVQPGQERVGESGSITRTLSVELGNGGEPGVSGDFRLPGFTAASRVELESVSYEDGSTWKLSRGESCWVSPDPVMLINQ